MLGFFAESTFYLLEILVSEYFMTHYFSFYYSNSMLTNIFILLKKSCGNQQESIGPASHL